MAIDRVGNRMVSGGLDYKLRFWDFHGMNKSINSFRLVEPIEGHPIISLSFSSTGADTLVVGGNA